MNLPRQPQYEAYIANRKSTDSNASSALGKFTEHYTVNNKGKNNVLRLSRIAREKLEQNSSNNFAQTGGLRTK